MHMTIYANIYGVYVLVFFDSDAESKKKMGL